MSHFTTCGLIILLAFASTALAVDGTVLINQSTITNGLTGCPTGGHFHHHLPIGQLSAVGQHDGAGRQYWRHQHYGGQRDARPERLLPPGTDGL